MVTCRSKYPVYLILMSAIILLCGGCAPNAAYRTEDKSTDCPADRCTAAVLEHNPSYDMGFVEFTDRGNVFNRTGLDSVLAYVEQQAATPEGASVVVFIHGWQHNASPEDSNLQSFRNMLSRAAELNVARQRRLIGIYIGWRGQSVSIPVAEFTTYWDRKRTAINVGHGGVTEVMLRLEHSLAQYNTPAGPNHNILTALGHSFGGAMLLAAVNEVLLDRVVNASPVGHEFCSSNASECSTCVETRTFGHGVILLNPAVEANELFPLKEVVASEHCYASTQQKLLHVVSSEADAATNIAFRAGQFVGVSITESELPLQRTYYGKSVTVNEHDLDTTTIGNYEAFRTGHSVKRTSSNIADCRVQDEWRNECYIPCKKDAKCLEPDKRSQHIPVGSNEPLHFLYTDSNFIKSHSDIFNPEVSAYITSVVMENSYKRIRPLPDGERNPLLDNVPTECLNKEETDFDFPHCFDHYTGLYTQGIPSAPDTARPQSLDSP